MAGRESHDEAVRAAIMIGRIYRDKQFVFREGGLWKSIPTKGRDAIRKVHHGWPR